MPNLTGENILDAAISHIQDKSATMRSLLAGWLNSLYLKTAIERDWLFLEKRATVAIAGNVIPKPADFSRLVSITGTGFFLDDRHRLTPRESYAYTDDTATDPLPLGFEETDAALTLRPGGTGSVTLCYIQQPAAAADTSTVTLWPQRFLPLFERSLLSAYYEYDNDQRGLPSLTLDRAELDLLKYADNMQKPVPKASRKGLLRTR